jgi:hypothetical protein
MLTYEICMPSRGFFAPHRRKNHGIDGHGRVSGENAMMQEISTREDQTPYVAFLAPSCVSQMLLSTTSGIFKDTILTI